MGIAKEWASQIRESREQRDAAEQQALRKSLAIESGAPALWNELQTEIESIVKEFCAELPEAKGLGAARLNSNNLTVQTIAFPIIKVEMIRDSNGYIRSTVTETKHGLAETRVRQSQQPIGYTTGRDGKAYFSYGEMSLTPQQLAKELMQPVFTFFKEAALS